MAVKEKLVKIVRTTLVQPRKGYEAEVASLLHELEEFLSQQPGFIEGYEVHDENSMGRISVWTSKEDADHAATLVHTIALRAKVHARTLPVRRESLLRVDQEHHVEAPAAIR